MTTRGFGEKIKHSNNAKATVGGYSGVDNIVNMWKDHFQALYNSTNIHDARDRFDLI